MLQDLSPSQKTAAFEVQIQINAPEPEGSRLFMVELRMDKSITLLIVEDSNLTKSVAGD